ncbi:MAG: DNA polymerase III subunit alpha [Candidatus Nomurabacteria bacterium]|jgi:DNA polymerase-3 subunit alpha|nr:DNA polymerase III subunit alpha [Candidatus Nomurabacteria bacterium]
MSEGKKLKTSDFVHLHNHTNHSVLDGLTKIPELVELTKKYGMEAVAMTDHGTLSGWIELYKEARDNGVKPILGYEAYVAPRTYKDRDPQKDKSRCHITLLAMNNDGVKNLMRLSTKANLEGFYYKPRVDHDLLREYNEGIICLSGCIGSEVSEALRGDDYETARKIAEFYRDIFGDRYYLELQDHGHVDAPKHYDEQKKVNDGLDKLHDELGIPRVISCDAHYPNIEDTDAHEVLLCVGTGALLSDTNRMSMKDFQLHVTDPKDIIARWGQTHRDAILNTKKIADRCVVDIELGGMLIPTFACPDGKTEEEYLSELVYSGLAERYGGIPPEQAEKLTAAKAKKLLNKEQSERAEYELSVISKMGFCGYFLIVWDFIKWGREQRIVFGPGRGSAAGSIIAYALRITDLDPLKYDLLFERFLNPDRISMPDIDIDIQDTRRDEVVEYCANKYGQDRVSNILTFGKMAARSSVRDVARVLNVPYADADKLSKTVPDLIQGRHVPLSKSVEEDSGLRAAYGEGGWKREVLDYAKRLEGTIRSHGVHACGVVIAPDALVNHLPLEMAQKGVIATQFPMGQIEDLGLLKMDFLGLSNLTVISNTIRIVRKVYDENVDLSQLSLEDKKTYELFQRADTTGVFQLESGGMKRYLKDLKASKFEDIIAMVALYRPGPMQFIDSFIRRKHGKEKITYLDPHMKEALETTYGILVYQEQFMQISKDMCGFTGGEADTLRKAVGKKKMDMMLALKPKFIDGAVERSGAKRADMEKFWEQLVEFANYCFNKSHAACYALIAYWTAYLKAHYPAAFMAALMTSDSGNTDRLAIEIAECNKIGIKVLAPDINESFEEFAVVPETENVRFGLAAVKGVGRTVVEEILGVRENGPFESIEDYCRRVNSRISNKKVWESLIKSGAFDSFGDRSDLLFSLEAILEFAQKVQKEAASGQADLFGLMEEDVTPEGALATVSIATAPDKHTDKEKLMWERELLGLYLSAHPLDKYDGFFAANGEPIEKITPERDGQSVEICGIVDAIRIINTKKGDKMAFVTVEDKTGAIDVVTFPSVYKDIADKLAQDEIVRIYGRISGKSATGAAVQDANVIANKVIFVSDDDLSAAPDGDGASKPNSSPTETQEPDLTEENAVEETSPTDKKIYIHVKNPDDTDSLTLAKEALVEFPGPSEIILVLGEDKKDALRLPFTARACEGLVDKLAKVYGDRAVALK